MRTSIETKPAKNAGVATVRCAIYTRKSSEQGLEQEFNSLHAQCKSGEADVASMKHEGWVALPDQYNDGGFTGGKTDRPGCKRLMADIEAGKVDCVVVYKVDRLSRSLMDFARMMAVFEKHHISIVSVADLHERLAKANERARAIRSEAVQIEGEAFTRDDVVAALGEFGATWDVLCPREQAAVLANLVKRVDYDGAKKTVAITFHSAGLTTPGQAPIEHEEVA